MVPNGDAPAKEAATPAAETRHGKAEGPVTAINAATGSVTLDHGPIAALEWPPMTMGFAADPDMLKDIAVGDRVAFELDWDGKTGTVTKLDKAR